MNTPAHQNIQVAVDTGGTFTDLGVRSPTGEVLVWKVPSTPSAPDDAVIDGLTGAMDEHGHRVEDIDRLVHGTTVATNTVLTRSGARVGLLTTAGFRDVLAIGYQARPSLYDNRIHRVPPLIPGEHIVELSERIGFDGEIITPIDDAELDAAAEKLKDLELDALVVSFLNAYADSHHEDYAADRLRKLGVAGIVSTATSITSEMREYDRTSTAAVNAYVRPAVSQYMGRLETRVEELGIPSRLWVMQSNGGLLNPELAGTHSARTVLSGLAGGVVGAANWARLLDLPGVVSLDIGGTSSDIALIRDGEPDETTAGEIDSLPLRLPSVDVHTIGAGGGSIAWIDSGGSLRVGPHSAGADPGPIAYQQGGTEVTVTDAHLALGRLGSSLLGGRFDLDYDAAHAGLSELGDKLGLSAEDCAEGVLKVIAATMGRGIRKVSVERGVDVRSCALMAFGGAGPLHGSDLVHELGMERAVIPPMPGVASAVGMLDAPVRHDFAQPVSADDSGGYERLPEAFDRLRQRAAEELDTTDFEESTLVDARYTGQSYELTINWAGDWDLQRQLLDEAHEQRYGFRDDDAHMEVVVARIVATIPSPTRDAAPASADPQTTAHPKDHREVYVDGAWTDTPIYDRDELRAGVSVAGPAIIDQFDSTTYVRPDQSLTCDEHGFFHLIRKEA